MKNITITLPDDALRWLRIRAAEEGCSMSRWLAGLVAEMRQREDAYDIAMDRYLSRNPRRLKWIEGRRPTREELHDRARLR